MFCHKCGTSYDDNSAKFCSSCGVEFPRLNPPVSLSQAACSSHERTPLSFKDYMKKTNEDTSFDSIKNFKKRERKDACRPTKKKKQSSDETVKINIGIVEAEGEQLKVKRGSLLPIDVKKSHSEISVRRLGVQKQLAHNKNLREGDDGNWQLLYPDFDLVHYIPGTKIPFSVEKYKDALGRPFNRLNLYICKTADYDHCNGLESDPDNDELGTKHECFEEPHDEEDFTFPTVPGFKTHEVPINAEEGPMSTPTAPSRSHQVVNNPTVPSGNPSTDSPENPTINAISSVDVSAEPVVRVVRTIKIHRTNVRKDMIVYFSDPTILHDDVVMVVINQRGEEEEGKGIGVTRDVYSMFWTDVCDSLMVGEAERIPGIRHDYQKMEWEAIGRVLLKGYISCHYFPLQLSKTFMMHCLFGEDDITGEMLMESFKRFVSESERRVIESSISGELDVSDDQVEELLSTFDCKKKITKENLEATITEIAHKELIQKPQYVAECWKSIVPDLREYFPFKQDLDDFYSRLTPSTENVLASLQVEVQSEAEKECSKHLKRYIRGLDASKLAKFLRFVSGSDLMLFDHLQISFTALEGAQRRPIAHTCNFVLEVPSTYQSFPELREEFNYILESSSWEIDIV